MSFAKASEYLKSKGMQDRIMEFEVSSATVELAAEAIGCAPERIAKSLTFMVDGGAVMVVCAGDAKIANSKYKAQFNTKAKMLSREEVTDLIGHDVGGVCPFGINHDVKVYLDNSLKRFEEIFPACGSSNSAVRLTPEELNTLSNSLGWIDVCSIPDMEE